MERISLSFIVWTVICISLMGFVGWIMFGVMVLGIIVYMVIKDIVDSRKLEKESDADAGVADGHGREGQDEGAHGRYYYEKYLERLNDK